MPSKQRRLAKLDKENKKHAKSNQTITAFMSTPQKRTSNEVPENDCEIVSQPVSCQLERSTLLLEISSARPETPSKCASDSESTTVPLAKRRKVASGHKVGFDPEWQKGRPWLIHRTEETSDGNESVMYCKLCKKFNSTGLNGSRTWVDTGYKTIRFDKVKDHENSSQHKHALSLSLNETVTSLTDKVNSAAQTAILDALKVLQFIIVKNLSLSLFADLTDLCIEVGSVSLEKLRLAKNASYTSWDIVQDLLQLLYNEVQDELKSVISASPCFATMVDEVCDLTNVKHMAMCCNYVSDSGELKTTFLCDTTLKSATADVITETIQKQVEDHDLQMNKMTGFASDGAAVFTGKHTGVATQLKAQQPSLVTVHCKDHRLALACRDSFQKVPLFKKTDKLLEDVYKYYKRSSKKTASLKEVQTSFQDPPLSIKEAKHHRWLSHDKAVKSIVKSYHSLVVDLESHTISEDPVGNGILKMLKNPVNLHILLLLADILPHLAALSCFFQMEGINLGMADANVNKTLRILEKRKTENGTWLAKASSIMTDCDISSDTHADVSFSKARIEFLSGLTENITRRFTDCDIVEALSVLDLSQLQDIPSFHGTTEMDLLADKYLMDADNLQMQWQGFTELMTTTPVHNRRLQDLAELFHGKQHLDKGLSTSYPLVAHLVAVALTLPLSTAEVERVFSHLKLIKTDHRCLLTPKTLNMLLTVKLNCGSEQFDKIRPRVVANFFKKDRRLVSVIASHLKNH